MSDEIVVMDDANATFDPAPVSADASTLAMLQASADVPAEASIVDTHESVLRRLMNRLEAIGQGLDSELSHWMQRARDLL